MQPKGAPIRKRTQIIKANRVMFFWVAGVSVILGFSSIGVMFLTQMLFFNERVLHEKSQTVSNLDNNLAIVADLKSNVNVLSTNQALTDSKSISSDDAIQAVLDALPSDANSLALGASLKDRLLFGISGLNLDALKVDQVAGIETLDTSASVADSSTPTSDAEHEITFTFSVTGGEEALKQALVNLEKSIRTIEVTSLKIESQGETPMLTVQARAFYEPARVVELRKKTVK